jgi:hypothetical protein
MSNPTQASRAAYLTCLKFNGTLAHPSLLMAAIRFPRLFDICATKNISVAQALPVSPNSLQFRRSFGPDDLDLWASLVLETNSFSIIQLPDSVSWGLESNGKFWYPTCTVRLTKALASLMRCSFGVLNFRWKLKSSSGRWPKADSPPMLRLIDVMVQQMASVPCAAR